MAAETPAPSRAATAKRTLAAYGARLSLKQKIIALACLAAVLPVAATVVVTMIMDDAVERRISEEVDSLMRENITHVATDIYGLCKTTHDLVSDRLQQDVSTADLLLERSGGVLLGTESHTVQARNDRTGEVRAVTLPRLLIGGIPLSMTRSAEANVMLVDEVARLTGTDCTLYQRMDPEGDMLRVASSVVHEDGTRAGVGAYMPAVLPGGTANPVIETVLAGREFSGTARAQGADWMVRYRPVRDDSGTVVGMLGVGMTLTQTKALRLTILNTRIGEDGYVWVLATKGPDKGRYIVSRDGARDGEIIIDATDADGEYFVREMIDTALAAEPGTISYKRYQWTNPGEKEPRTKLSAFTYFEPWDWVIGVGVYEEDYDEAREELSAALWRMRGAVVLAGLVIVGLMAGAAVYLGTRMTRPLAAVTRTAAAIAGGDVQRARKELARGGDPAEDANSRDEVRRLRASMAAMTENLHALLAQVRTSGIQVQTSATQIGAAAGEIDNHVSEQAASTTEVGAAAKEIAATSDELASNMADMTETASKTAELAGAGQDGLEEITSVMASLDGATGLISDKLGDISARAASISEVVATITKVANQTNMLSLNAAIEAEKAGEYGLGFSVVAREIRRLADQTAVATLDIEEMVGAMQDAVDDGVKTMSEFTERVERGAATVNSIGEDLSRIMEGVLALTPRIDTVNQGVQMQSDGARQISEAIEDLSSTAEQTKASLADFSRAADQLSEAVKGLHREMARFSVES